MTDSDFERVMDVLEGARVLRGEERARFLESACGDDHALRAEVESLLPHADVESGPVDGEVVGLGTDELRGLVGDATNVFGFAAHDDDPATPLPEQIGPFKIVRRIATGGMGTVFEAEQQDPARRVALKMVRRELFTPSTLKRFRREALILGRLQHPGIAQVFEAGTVDEGDDTLPYFAMEYVDGKPLGLFASEADLDERSRLKLFAQICDAVHHAHTQGVVHRDIKPDNILVTTEGHPKVLDFGVARITASDVQVATLVTEVGQLMGTLPYMSPEQVIGKPEDIDARSDVYALGVVLFELLSGRRPLELSQRTLPDATRIIRDDEPTRLGSMATRWRGDIDTIVGKALEKEAARRYAGADELAADVRRYLASQPIDAHAPSRFYQVRKFTQRHRGLVVGVSIAFVALMVGLAFSLKFAFDESDQRRAAEFAGYRALVSAAEAALDDQEYPVARVLLNEAPEAQRGWEWHHAAARAEPMLWELPLDLSTPLRHSYTYPAQAFSPDGRLLAALVAEDRVDVFAAESGARQYSLSLGSSLQRHCLAATAEGFITLTASGHVAHWDGPTGELLQEQTLPDFDPRGHGHMDWNETTQRLAFMGVVYADSEDATDDFRLLLYLGAIGSLEVIETDLSPFRFAWTPDGQALVSMIATDGGYDWIVSDVVPDGAGALTLRLRNELNAARFFDLHEDRALVMPTGGKSDKLAIVDMEGQVLVPLDPHVVFSVVHGAFSADDRRIVTTSAAGPSRIVTVFDAASGRALTRWPVPQDSLGALSPTGELLAIGNPDRLSVHALDSTAASVLPGADEYVYDLAWAPDGRTLWARNFDLSYRGYDVAEGTVILDVPAPGVGFSWGGMVRDSMSTWGLTVDGRRLVATHGMALARDDPRMRVSTHDLESGGAWREIPGVGWDAKRTTYLQDLFTLPRASRLEFLRATGAIEASGFSREDLALVRRAGSSPRVQADPSGQILVGPVATYLERVDGSERVPLLVGGRALPLSEEELEQEGHRDASHSDVSFSPDGSLLAASRPKVHDGVVVHDVRTGDSVVELLTELDTALQFFAVAFSPDGQRLAVGGMDRVVSVFDTTTWQLVTRLEGHLGYVKDIAWSPDGRTLATASGDGTVRLWHTSSRVERTAAAHAAATHREQQRPWVSALFDELDDPHAVAEAVRAKASLDADGRHAALRVVRELANAWWAAHDDAPSDASDDR